MHLCPPTVGGKERNTRIDCMRLKRIYMQFPSYVTKIMLGDMNAKLGKEIWTGIAVGT